MYALILIRCQLAPPGTFEFLMTDLAGIQIHTNTHAYTDAVVQSKKLTVPVAGV